MYVKRDEWNNEMGIKVEVDVTDYIGEIDYRFEALRPGYWETVNGYNLELINYDKENENVIAYVGEYYKPTATASAKLNGGYLILSKESIDSILHETTSESEIDGAIEYFRDEIGSNIDFIIWEIQISPSEEVEEEYDITDVIYDILDILRNYNDKDKVFELYESGEWYNVEYVPEEEPPLYFVVDKKAIADIVDVLIKSGHSEEQIKEIVEARSQRAQKLIKEILKKKKEVSI